MLQLVFRTVNTPLAIKASRQHVSLQGKQRFGSGNSVSVRSHKRVQIADWLENLLGHRLDVKRKMMTIEESASSGRSSLVYAYDRASYERA